MFKELRAWQLTYAGRTGEQPTGNMFAPCPMRDHHEVGREILIRLGARPMHDEAAHALADEEYARRMIAYGADVSRLLDPMWGREVLDREPCPAGGAARLFPVECAGP